jgi:hypothetical protein
MTVLSRLTKLGMARRDDGTYLAPTVSVPFNMGTKYNDVTAPLRDESVRANDSVVQGITPGAIQSTWQVDVNGYADFIGHFFVAMGLFDTVTAGVTTTLSGNTTANAATISLTASVAPNTVLKISDTAGANLEYVKISTVTGAGPYVATITQGGGTGGNTTQYAHTASGGAVVSQSSHAFAQNRTFSTVWPKYCFTTDDGVDQRGWQGCCASDLQIKIDPKGFLIFSAKYAGLQSTSQSTFSYAASTLQPTPGWAWTVTNAGGASTRGLTMDITLKRAQDIIHASTGLQTPREIFAGALEVDGAYKAVFENDNDINLFRNYTQTPTVHTLSNPLAFGGQVLAITMSQSGYTTSVVDLTSTYTQLTQSLTGIQNTTDGGVTGVTLTNWQATAF